MAWVPNHRGAGALGDSHGSDHHLGRSGQHVGARRDVGLSGFGSQRHVTERADVVDVDSAGAAGESAVVEPVHVQLGVSHLDGTNHSDDTGLGKGRGQNSHHKATLVGGGGVGRDVGQPEGVGRGSPREGDVGEVGGDLL